VRAVLERSRPETCLSDPALDRLLAGELADAPERSRMEAHLASCPLCRERHAALARGAAPAPDRAWLDRQGETRIRASRRRRASMGVGAAAVATVACLVLIGRWQSPPTQLGEAPDPARSSLPAAESTRGKGGFAMDVVVRRSDGRVESVTAGAALHPGDAIRFRLTAPKPGFAAIFGLARGDVAVYAPMSSGELRLPEPGTHEVDGSVILDDALGEEVVLAVLCETPSEAAAAVDRARLAMRRAGARGARPDNLDIPCLQTKVVFHKQALR
jgi:hypothetical protein